MKTPVPSKIEWISGIDLNRFGEVLYITYLSGTKTIGFNTAEVALTHVVIILLAKPVDISKRSAECSVSMPCRSFVNINNSLSLPQSLRPGPNFLGIALNFLIIWVDEFFYLSIAFLWKEKQYRFFQIASVSEFLDKNHTIYLI